MTQKLRCAIYTRKSTEEGLEQDFNSLDAQREACEAYINSQRHEGWKLLPALYNDGGISGGTMERPALKNLLYEVKAGRIDIIVVYKVDRLTRALSDFAKMVDLFDEHKVSFVSVTQQFNTTSSMGRLTLNVLLSFAQFEREVTAERIRDKIAASKKKGMWMGGLVPIGYEAINKKLAINKKDAETVRKLFDLYLEVGSVGNVIEKSKQLEILTKISIDKNGHKKGGRPFTRGHLYRLLNNQIYIGKVTHKDKVYEGNHDAIIEDDVWEKTQAILKANATFRKNGTNLKAPNLLTGLLFDDKGIGLTPNHSFKGTKRYRYYISRADKYGKAKSNWRLPAKEIEEIIATKTKDFLNDGLKLIKQLGLSKLTLEQTEFLMKNSQLKAHEFTQMEMHDQRKTVLQLIKRINIYSEKVEIEFLKEGVIHLLELDETKAHGEKTIIETSPIKIKKRGVEKKLILLNKNKTKTHHDSNLIKAIAEGRTWFNQLLNGTFNTSKEIAKEHNTDTDNVWRSMRLAFLAPDIVEAILQGQQPIQLTSFKLKRLKDLPLDWNEQRKLLGFSHPNHS